MLGSSLTRQKRYYCNNNYYYCDMLGGFLTRQKRYSYCYYYYYYYSSYARQLFDLKATMFAYHESAGLKAVHLE